MTMHFHTISVNNDIKSYLCLLKDVAHLLKIWMHHHSITFSVLCAKSTGLEDLKF